MCVRVSESKAYPGERGEVLPASPLPWREGFWSWHCPLQHEHHGRRTCRYEPEYIAMTGEVSRDVVGHGATSQPPRTGVAKAYDPEDAAYIVEACNSYPALRERVARLTDALREALEDANRRGELPVRPWIRDARALLESVSPVYGVSPEKGRSTP